MQRWWGRWCVWFSISMIALALAMALAGLLWGIDIERLWGSRAEN